VDEAGNLDFSWELGDDRSHKLIEDMIATEFDIFRLGKVTYF
jgi:hypothetical protein